MHSLQGCFFAAFIEGSMPGSHNSKYYAKSLKRNKVQLHNIAKLFKRSKSENTANKTLCYSRTTRRGWFYGNHRRI